MPSEQDQITDAINKPMLIIAGILVVAGFLMCLTIALMPIGLPVMAIGGIWAAVLYGVAKSQTRINFPK